MGHFSNHLRRIMALFSALCAENRLDFRTLIALFTAYYADNMKYIHELPDWPTFTWQQDQIVNPLVEVRHLQGKLLGKLEGLGFNLRNEASLQTLTEEVVKSSDIEGEVLPSDQVRSSIARRLGLTVAGLVPSDRNVEGIVDMMLDATQQYDKPLTINRLLGWHAALFPTGYSGMNKITVGAWRINEGGPMQVVSGAMGIERVHFEAPHATRLASEMENLLGWFNAAQALDPVLKAAIAHLWFVTIHPFDDGNGRIARAITDMQLARSDGSPQRFYSMSSQIRKERSDYYDCLEKTQHGNLDITKWLVWFLGCLKHALITSEENLVGVLSKARFWEKHQFASLNARQLEMINKLWDGFEGKLTTSKWAKITKCSPDTALRDIQQLMDWQILEKEPAGGRSTNYRLKV
jgi:Fic family protein